MFNERLRDLRQAIEYMMKKDDLSDYKRNRIVRNLKSIYCDITAMDCKKQNLTISEQISQILHFAYEVNGSFAWEKTGVDTYSVYFYGNYRDDLHNRTCVRFDLQVLNGFARFKGYEIF